MAYKITQSNFLAGAAGIVADSSLVNNDINFYVDPADNVLKAKIRDNTGTLQTLRLGEANTISIADTVSGIWGVTTPAVNIRIGFINDKQVSISYSAVSVAATTSGVITFATALPVQFRPTTEEQHVVKVEDNASEMLGICTIAVDGTITISASVRPENFTGTATAGNSGFFKYSFIYDISL